jgi:excinuclease ABC subunit C
VGRPCLLGYIDRCSAPCVGRVNAEEHRRIVEDFCEFMAGQTGRFLRRLEGQMREAADAQDYERAARLRDDIGALRRAMEKQAVVLPDGTDADVIAFAHDELEAAVQVFYVRGGRVRGQRGWVVDRVDDTTVADLVEQFLAQEYLPSLDASPGLGAGASAEAGNDAGADTGNDSGAGAGNEIPREVLVPELPPDAEAVAELLSLARGSRVDLRVPRRGDKRTLFETVESNAKQALALHRTKRASDLTARSRALSELQEALELPDAPLRIECFDISNTQGSDVVASMVVFEDGLARKSEYRRFAIRGVTGQDDVASMHETISRRFSRYLAERARTGELPAPGEPAVPSGPTTPGGPTLPAEPATPGEATVLPGEAGEPPARGGVDPETGRPRKFAYPPNLVVVDGGPPQVAAARQALDELGIDGGPGGVSLCGLAKRLEEVWLPDVDEPVILPRTSEALYLLQRIRDEAHRFAITYHRQKRSKSMVASALDDVPGLGQTRRTALLRHFGSLAKLREATAEQIAEVPGIGAKTAAAVVAALRDPSTWASGGAGGTSSRRLRPPGATAPGSAAAPLPAFDPTTGEIIETGGPAVPAGASPEAVPEAPSAAPSAASTLPRGD